MTYNLILGSGRAPRKVYVDTRANDFQTSRFSDAATSTKITNNNVKYEFS